MIISVLNQKGGVGKTTLSVNLARIFQLNNYRTLLVDSDPQGSARDWHERSSGEYLNLIALDRPTLKTDINKFKTTYDVIIIDGAPMLSVMASSAIYCSDVVLIPVQPSPYDVWATEDIVNLVNQKRLSTDSPKAAFVLSRKINKTKISEDVRECLSQFEIPVFKHGTHQRVAYSYSATLGQSVMDFTDDEAKKDITGVFLELLEFANEETRGRLGNAS